ncbi:MAG: hypothetical protein HY663_01825 [Chloroflexi bacterium]|nr:hypothetical protein [Chloroflexota bacterium]
MSKFIDKLNRLSRAESQPIGFRTAQTASPRPKIQLVASLAQENSESLVDRIAGADAGLLGISKPGSALKALQKISQAVPDIPWGGWLQDSGTIEIKQWLKAGDDFMVFPAATTPLTLLHNDEVGKILEVEASLSEGLLRATNELPIDAVLITSEESEGYSLTWQHLMLFQRFADLLTKPLLVSIPSKVTAEELQALWAAGVDAVILGVIPEQPPDILKELRQVIDKLAFPLPRQREKREPLLPRMGREPAIATAEEEEEEE